MDDKQVAERIRKECVANGDTEAAHIDADGILCELLHSLGYVETVAAYHEVGKWYA